MKLKKNKFIIVSFILKIIYYKNKATYLLFMEYINSDFLNANLLRKKYIKNATTKGKTGFRRDISSK